MEKFYFVMPAYNEAENIQQTIRQWYPVVEKINQMEACEAVLAIADDGSKDNTYQIMSQAKEEGGLEHFEPVTKPNGGHGQTVLFLYRHALAHGADYVFQTDSDGQTNPDEFWQMFEHRHDYDFQIGYRKGRQDGAGRVFVAVKWDYRIKFYEITFKPRQGGVNSINMKRIFKIGWKALGDFRRINRNIKKKNS